MDKQKDKYTVRTEHAAHVSAVRQCYLVLPETWQAEFKSDEGPDSTSKSYLLSYMYSRLARIWISHVPLCASSNGEW